MQEHPMEGRKHGGVDLQAEEGKERRESEKSVKKEAGRQKRGEFTSSKSARRVYKQGSGIKKEDTEEKDKGRRGSIHSNSVVKATACPTARRYLWGGSSGLLVSLPM